MQVRKSEKKQQEWFVTFSLYLTSRHRKLEQIGSRNFLENTIPQMDGKDYSRHPVFRTNMPPGGAIQPSGPAWCKIPVMLFLCVVGCIKSPDFPFSFFSFFFMKKQSRVVGASKIS